MPELIHAGLYFGCKRWALGCKYRVGRRAHGSGQGTSLDVWAAALCIGAAVGRRILAERPAGAGRAVFDGGGPQAGLLLPRLPCVAGMD